VTPVVALIIAANAVVFFLQNTVPGLTDRLVLFPPAFLAAPWTFFTSMFSHASFTHILFNMFALWLFGPRVEARYGSAKFLGLYLASGIVGNLGAFLNPAGSYLGASGAIMGVALAYARYWPRDKVLIYGIIPMTTRTMVIVYAVWSVVAGIGNLEPGVAQFIHLGGLAGGWLYCVWAERYTGARAFRRRADQPLPGAPPPMEVTAVLRDRLSRWDAIRADDLHPVNREELQRIRGKIAAQGLGALTAGDVEFLERFSNRH
jgi:membrane associated rhomboid family serine protease